MAGKADNLDHRARHRARHRLVQALYQWQIGGDDPLEIERQFLYHRHPGSVDQAYFADLMRAVPAELERLDAAIDPWLDRPFTTLDPVEKVILRLGSYELLERPEVPYRVVLNEAVELTRVFGGEQSHRFVNGVLDRVGRADSRRSAELQGVPAQG